MGWRSETIKIRKVGLSGDPRLAKVGRGVFEFESILDFISQPFKTDLDEVIIDLTLVGWVSLFDWSVLTCLLHDKLEKNSKLQISLDFIGMRAGGLIAFRECADFINNRL
jgi:hypothetical protein